MGILGWLIFALLALLLAALLLPWHVRFVGRTAPPRARVELRLFAGYAPPIPIPMRGKRKGAESKRRKAEKGRKRRRTRKHGLPAGIGDLALGILSAIRLRRIRIAGRIGLDDPADTGTLWGYATPFVHGLSGPGRVIDLAPDFSGARLDLEASGEVAIRPVRLLRAGAVFGWANLRPAS